MPISPFLKRFSYTIFPARYLSTLLSQNLSGSNSTILPSTDFSSLRPRKFYVTPYLNLSLHNLGSFALVLAISPCQIERKKSLFSLRVVYYIFGKHYPTSSTAFQLLKVQMKDNDFTFRIATLLKF